MRVGINVAILEFAVLLAGPATGAARGEGGAVGAVDDPGPTAADWTAGHPRMLERYGTRKSAGGSC